MIAYSIESVLDNRIVEVRQACRPAEIMRPAEILRAVQMRSIANSPLSSALSLQIDHLYTKFRAGTAPQLAVRDLVMLVDGQRQQVVERKPSRLEAVSGEEILSSAMMAERLDKIKNQLALSITQMAELFSVTRKSVYDWYDGAEPRSDKLSRMEILNDVIAVTPATVDMRRLKSVWNVCVEGKSFLAVFSDDSLENTALEIALTKKLHELFPRMVTTTSLMARNPRSNVEIGSAHLAEFDRQADIG